MCEHNEPRVDDDATLPEVDISGYDPSEDHVLSYHDQEIKALQAK
jgi:hypothetical protein